jgi:hypothetical protein
LDVVGSDGENLEGAARSDGKAPSPRAEEKWIAPVVVAKGAIFEARRVSLKRILR